MNCLGMFSPSAPVVCEPLRKLTSPNANGHVTPYTKTYKTEQTNSIKKSAIMPFYNAEKQLYLETGASGICLGVSLVQDAFPKEGSS